MQPESHMQSSGQPSKNQPAFDERLEPRFNLAKDLSSKDAMEQVLTAIQAEGYDRVRLYRLSEDERVTAIGQVGMQPEFVGTMWSLDEDIFMQRLREHPFPHICRITDAPLMPHEKALDKEGVQEWACVPLIVRGQVIGQIAADNKSSRRPITQSGLNRLNLYAAQAAAILALDQAERKAMKLDASLRVSRAVNSSLDLEQIFRETCKAAVELTEVDFSAVILFDSDLESGRVQVEYPEKGVRGLRIPFREIPNGKDLIKSREPLLLSDVQNLDPSSNLRQILDRWDIHSLTAFPIVNADRVIGAFSLNSIGKPKRLTREETEFCQILADQVAVAVKNVQQISQLKSLTNAAKAIAHLTAGGDLQQTLEKIAEGAKMALNCDAVVLYIYDQSRRTLPSRPTYVGVKYPAATWPDDPDLQVPPTSVVYQVLHDRSPWIVENVHKDSRFNQHGFLFREGIESLVAVSLRDSDNPVGVLFLNFHHQKHFTRDEVENIQFLADQAAVAVSNAQLYEENLNTLTDQSALVGLSEKLIETFNYEEVLNHVVIAAAKLFAVEFSSIVMPENQNLPDKLNDLVLKAGVGWGSNLLGEWKLPRGAGSHAGFVLMTENLVAVEDYEQESRFELPAIAKEYGVKAGLGVPIRIEGRAIGALLVQTSRRRTFSEREKSLMKLIANQAASAIQTCWQYQGAAILALTGLPNSTWRHSVVGHAVSIRDLTELYRRSFAKSRLAPLGLFPAEGVEEMLGKISALANKILQHPIIPPSEETGVVPIQLNEFLRREIQSLWAAKPDRSAFTNWLWESERTHGYETAIPHMRLNLAEEAAVRVNPEWLRIGVELLIDNAVKAMADRERRELTLETRMANNRAQISISDTGPGLPDEVLVKLFRGRIEKVGRNGKGSGIGMLIAQAIFRAYRGDIRVARTGPEGTEVVVQLPLEQQTS
jgi:GAF domain-containing protein